ncbi:MAG: hypothetical protein HOY44_22155 [Maritimibacter sp.]|jgi:hypothetical protein|uniref:hypothetical protein n=1 Tax=Maritimibacter sp. TaxID=2003363 RepID=UPI001DA8A8D8|nr:hypothetical protein [Maritimibacter sp.]MBL6430224.1 hypothetical protein [Maritimibacter sp.]
MLLFALFSAAALMPRECVGGTFAAVDISIHRLVADADEFAVKSEATCHLFRRPAFLYAVIDGGAPH